MTAATGKLYCAGGTGKRRARGTSHFRRTTDRRARGILCKASSSNRYGGRWWTHCSAGEPAVPAGRACIPVRPIIAGMAGCGECRPAIGVFVRVFDERIHVSSAASCRKRPPNCQSGLARSDPRVECLGLCRHCTQSVIQARSSPSCAIMIVLVWSISPHCSACCSCVACSCCSSGVWGPKPLMPLRPLQGFNVEDSSYIATALGCSSASEDSRAASIHRWLV